MCMGFSAKKVFKKIRKDHPELPIEKQIKLCNKAVFKYYDEKKSSAEELVKRYKALTFMNRYGDSLMISALSSLMIGVTLYIIADIIKIGGSLESIYKPWITVFSAGAIIIVILLLDFLIRRCFNESYIKCEIIEYYEISLIKRKLKEEHDIEVR